VPRDAVVTRDGKPVVFVVGGDNKVQPQPVATGAEVQGQLTVRSGLQGGEAVVVRPPESLKAGDVVRPRKG
jgi:hypothetical protein